MRGAFLSCRQTSGLPIRRVNRNAHTHWSVEFDAVLFAKWHRPGSGELVLPREERFDPSFDAKTYANWLRRRNRAGARRALALTIQAPLLGDGYGYRPGARRRTVRPEATQYLSRLIDEINLQSSLVGAENAVDRICWEASITAHFTPEQTEALMRAIRRNFKMAVDRVGEYWVSFDPRKTRPAAVAPLRALGMNHLAIEARRTTAASRAVVDEDRHAEVVNETLRAARQAGFRVTVATLPISWPEQDMLSLSRRLDWLIAAEPTRVLFEAGESGNAAPRSLQADLHALLFKKLTRARYRFIGANCFARDDDELSSAKQQGRLFWNRLGYTTQADADEIGLGASALGSVGPTHSRNRRALDEYYAALAGGDVPIDAGYQMSPDELLRRAIALGLLCHSRVSVGTIEQSYLVNFRDYFRTELAALADFAADDLVRVDRDSIAVTPKGEHLLGRICQVFDTPRGAH
jgi:oxygen-independent coproporphyrinogen III oxidase